VRLIWRIYYADGSTFDNIEGEWEDAPGDGVIAVVVTNPEYGRWVFQGCDFYLKPEHAEPEDLDATNDINAQLRARCPWLKFGLGVTREEWKGILRRAIDDTDFPSRRHPMRRRTDRGDD
jgi:hypothetical protein